MHGTTVCRMHGGSAPQVKAAARVRLERAADRMAKELLGIATDDATPAPVKLAAIRDALDRAGVSAKTAVDVTVGPAEPWEAVFAGLAGGTRAESRAARGVADDEAGEIVDADWSPEDEVETPPDAARGATPPAPANDVAPQPDLDRPDANAAAPVGQGGAPGGGGAVQPRTATPNGGPPDNPIRSLEELHPDPAPDHKSPRPKRNPAITPKMRDRRRSRREQF